MASLLSCHITFDSGEHSIRMLTPISVLGVLSIIEPTFWLQIRDTDYCVSSPLVLLLPAVAVTMMAGRFLTHSGVVEGIQSKLVGETSNFANSRGVAEMDFDGIDRRVLQDFVDEVLEPWQQFAQSTMSEVFRAHGISHDQA